MCYRISAIFLKVIGDISVRTSYCVRKVSPLLTFVKTTYSKGNRDKLIEKAAMATPTRKRITDLTVDELKVQLEKRGLDKNGDRNALITKLKQVADMATYARDDSSDSIWPKNVCKQYGAVDCVNSTGNISLPAIIRDPYYVHTVQTKSI